MDFDGKVALVTGAGNGIGRQLALQLVGRGATVAAVDRDADRLQETAAMLAGKPATFHVVDVTDRDAVQRLASEVLAAHGALDVLINNAGIIQPFVKVADLELADIERVMGDAGRRRDEHRGQLWSRPRSGRRRERVQIDTC